jgi:curli production assembly/transport component CsgE
MLLFLAALSLKAQNIDSVAVIEDNIVPQENVSDHKSGLDLEISQLILDNTFSKVGNDFQQLFNTNWVWPSKNAAQFIITLTERPSFVNSTLIEISINDLKVYESFLQPRYDILEETVGQAIDVTLQYILNYEDVVKELSGDDLTGSGIY